MSELPAETRPARLRVEAGPRPPGARKPETELGAVSTTAVPHPDSRSGPSPHLQGRVMDESLYRSRHELVFVFGKREATRVNDVQLGKHGRNRTNVWNYPGMNSFARRGRTRGLDLHPTVKPITMVSDAILDVTQCGDIVLDPFCGSGTTILAAERTGRRGYAIELDPGHVDTAVGRWERMTKQSAVHATGKTFAEMRAERRSEDGRT
jgi:hypothetical protein